MFSKNLSLLVLECALVTLAFSSLISIVHANEEEPTEKPNPDEGEVYLFGSPTSVIMTGPSTSNTSAEMKSSKNALKTSFHQMDAHTLSQALLSSSNTAGVFTSRHIVPIQSVLLDFTSLSVESSHSTVQLSSLPASHVQTGIVLSQVQSLPVVSEETQSLMTTGLLRHSQYLTVASNETRHLQKSIQSSDMQSLSVVPTGTLPQQTSGLSRRSQDPFVVRNKTHHLQTSIPSRYMQSLPPVLTETLPRQTSSLSRHSENLSVASRQTRHLQAGVSSASIEISSQVPVHVQSSISSVISSPSLSKGRGVILNFTTAFSWTVPLSTKSSSATSHLIEGTGNSTKHSPMLQPSVQSSVVMQSALVGSVSTSFSGLSSLVASRTIMASKPPSKTSGHTITTFHSGPYSASWYQSSSVLPLPSPPPPDPPTVQEATALSADSVYLKWNGSHFQVVSNFTVEISVNSVTWEQVACKKSLMEEECVVTQKSAVVVGLQPYTNYTFRVFANSQFGMSNASVGNIWVTTNESVPSHPSQVGAQAVNSTVIFVNWTEPTEINGILVKYEVKYSEKDSSKSVVVNTSRKSLLLFPLKPYTLYVINISAFTHAGEGSRVTVQQQTHEAEPTGAPQHVLAVTWSSTSILVTWDPPLKSEQNGVIILYTVQYTSHSSGEIKRLNTTGNSTSIEVINLASYTTYSFSIKAWNAIGVGPWSGAVANATFESRPSPPRNLTAKSINSTAVKVAWIPSQNPNGEIKYRLFYWQSSEGPGAKRQAYDGPALEHVLAGLHEYVAYSFMLLAYNVKYSWSSAAVNSTETTHPAEPAGSPVNVTALANSSTSILVRWRPPRELDRNGIITNYHVNYNLSQGHVASITITGNRTEKLVSDLGKYTVYYFTVQAVNNIGVGPASQRVFSQTFEDVPGAPVITNVESTSTTLAVTWDTPAEPNGIIISFKLCWNLEILNNLSCVELPATDNLYNISNLKPFRSYNVSLSASTSVGLGAAFSGVYKTAVGVPGAPVITNVESTSTSLAVTWDPPAEPNGIIISFKLCWNLEILNNLSCVQLPATDNLYNISNLKPFSSYLLLLSGSTSVGLGTGFSVIYPTAEGVPGAPVITNVESTSTSLAVTWDTPAEPNGIIISFKLCWNLEILNNLSCVELPATDNLYNISNLKPFSTYNVSLSARTRVGLGSVFSGIYKTAEGVPGAPVITNVESTSTSLAVTWDTPAEPNGIIISFKLCWNLEILNNLSCVQLPATDNLYNISNLKPFRSYNVSLSASTSVGLGAAFSGVYKTAEGVPGAPVITNVEHTSTSLVVTWDPPAEANGVIESFKLCWNLEILNNLSCVELPNTDNLYNISNLKPYSLYNVSLSASTSVGLGAAFSGAYRTDEGVPSEPRQLQAWNTSGTSVFVTWKEPANMNGVLEHYKVFYKEAGGGESSIKNAGVSTNTSLAQLNPYTLYSITVQAFTNKGGGAEKKVDVRTDETAPSGITDISFMNPTSNSVKVIWEPPVKPNGEIGYYLLYWRTSDGGSVIRRWMFSGKVTYKLVSGLKPYVHYTFSVIPYNLRKSLKGPSINKSMTTNATAPSGPPLNVKIDNTTSTSITLSWDPPPEPNGKIIGYEVTYYESDPNKKNLHDNVKGRVDTLTGLEPWKTYHVAVACRSTGGIGPHSDWISKRTDAGAPPPIGTLAPPEEQKITSTTFEVELTKASNKNGDVRYYRVIVRELARDNKGNPVPPYDPDDYKTEDLKTYDEARRMKPTLVPYIAFQFSASDFDKFKRFTVGDGKGTHHTEFNGFFRRQRRSNGASVYYNGPLEEQTLYTVFQRAYVNEDVYTSSSWIDPIATEAAPLTPDPATPGVSSSTKVGLIVGLVFAILVVLVLILVGIIFIRKKRLEFDHVLDDRDDYSNGQPMRMKASRKRRSLQKRLMGSTDSLDALDELAANRARRQPVPIDDFERHVDRMHMDGDHGFSEEYTLVQPEEDFSFQQFLNPANKYKNRYANIVAYDHTRVLLNPVEGVAGSDYINANFIDGYNRPRAFIAAQGPLMETFDDFWRMIWEQRTLVIVMLTKLEERGRKKCDKYWPDRGAKTYGQVQVTLKETLNMSYYTVRKMTVSHKQFPDEERAIKQFHFTVWPDHGVPSHPTPLLSLVRHVSTSNRDAYGPMVVHCSAGVGRTGTFITLDVMLQKISEEDCIDVFGFVRQMRYQRNYMVQTEAQYVFIHDALLEAITCGVTEVEAKDLSTRLRELRQVDAENGYTYLENEFCRLAKEENHPIAFKSASLNCNTGKNRYANILPFESTRVHLKMRPGEMGSDYINANYIDGYCQPKAYIATQAPVPDTFEDFWRLLWEHESAAIVMLTMEEERGKIKCHRYWPSEGASRLYGVILVELVEEESYSDFITRKFKLTHTEEKDSRTVRQFQYTDWPDSGLPDSGVGIIDLIGQVQKWQQQSGNTAIVIHCSGGVGRTGVFCAISIMIERLKAEGVVDVFQTVQAMRLQRPAMVQTAEQYEFCYTTLQEYLDSFDLYANFQ